MSKRESPSPSKVESGLCNSPLEFGHFCYDQTAVDVNRGQFADPARKPTIATKCAAIVATIWVTRRLFLPVWDQAVHLLDELGENFTAVRIFHQRHRNVFLPASFYQSGIRVPF